VIFFLLLHGNQNLGVTNNYYNRIEITGVTDTLPSVSASLTKAMIHSLTTFPHHPCDRLLNIGILYLWLYYILPTGRLRVIKTFSSWS